MFETRAEAKQYAKDNGIKHGFWSGNRIGKQDDGSFAIISNFTDGKGNRMQSFTQDFGDDIGVTTGTTVRANDEMSRDVGWFSDEVTRRDGSVTNEGHPQLGLPAGSAVAGGLSVASQAPKLGSKVLAKLPRLDLTGKMHGVLPRIKDLQKYWSNPLLFGQEDLKDNDKFTFDFVCVLACSHRPDAIAHESFYMPPPL